VDTHPRRVGQPREARARPCLRGTLNLRWYDESLVREQDIDSKLTEIWRELQQQFDYGGHINYGTYDFVDGVANHVQGLTPSSYLFASGCNLRKAWLSS
jgi:hypothetical protein